MKDNDLTLLQNSPYLYKYNEELKMNNTEVGWEIIGPLIKRDETTYKILDISSNHNDVLLVKSMLEENLSKNIGENISLSSLRRFFGFIPSTNPNRKTDDIFVSPKAFKF